ncbi:hypothetical protein EV383_3498 [Pseudonocardia sediminis]|uniref:Uncharacterized protein n=1 Tax=Pseudonocardia sediminis TaxID=1397368 RepID=A0A4Q7UZZ0_PSEST|nr:hypothetical protein [Pseudonocardia sediminis]RZT86601.1 hypothetical protein EV383_3498 [Pseudonocardia sediminis]
MAQDSTVARILRRLRREIADMRRAHDVMWENLTRLDPDPSPYLHWEPSATGWRLYGALPPPDRHGT